LLKPSVVIINVVVGPHLHAGGVAKLQGTTGAKRYSRQARHLLGFVRPTPVTAATDKTSGEIAEDRSTHRM